jgi:hypothetical protein
MRSADLLDRHVATAGGPKVRELLVLWQHPDTREIVPIGRFDYNGQTYCFAYTRAAATIDGFRPLPGLGDLHRRYVSPRMPSVFSQRVMAPDRPDYAAYLRTIGLDSEHATPWEQIVYSGGSRAGDTLQFMQLPEVVDGRARARFLVNGIRHVPGEVRTLVGREITVAADQHEAILGNLETGDVLSVVAESSNPKDPSAALILADGVPIGWLPRVLSSSVRELLERGAVGVSVVRLGEPGTPPHLRLVLDLDVAVPDDFVFDRDGLWEPLSD